MAFNLPRTTRELRFTGNLRALATPSSSSRLPSDDDDDTQETQAFERDPYELGNIRPVSPAPPPMRAPMSTQPVWNVYAPSEEQAPFATPTLNGRPRRRGWFLVAWMLVSIVAGFASYKFSPRLVAAVSAAVHARR